MRVFLLVSLLSGCGLSNAVAPYVPETCDSRQFGGSFDEFSSSRTFDDRLEFPDCGIAALDEGCFPTGEIAFYKGFDIDNTSDVPIVLIANYDLSFPGVVWVANFGDGSNVFSPDFPQDTCSLASSGGFIEFGLGPFEFATLFIAGVDPRGLGEFSITVENF